MEFREWSGIDSWAGRLFPRAFLGSGEKLLPTASSPHSADANILPIPAPRDSHRCSLLGIPQPQKDPLSQGMLVRQYRFLSWL